jgi:hypothetical protein
MSIQLEVGDLVVTKMWDNTEKVEICQYKGQTGFLMYTLYMQNTAGILSSQLERFIRCTESLPYSSKIIRKSSSEEYYSKILETTNKVDKC